MVTREAWMMFGLVKVVVGAIWMHTALHARTRANFLETWITNRVSYPALATILHTYVLHLIQGSVQQLNTGLWKFGLWRGAANPNHAHTLSFWSDLPTERVWRKDGGVKEGLVGEQGRVVVTVNILSVDQIQRQTHTNTKTNTNREARRRGWLLGGESGHGWCSLRGGCWTWSQCAPPPVDQQIPIALLLPIQSRPLVWIALH